MKNKASNESLYDAYSTYMVETYCNPLAIQHDTLITKQQALVYSLALMVHLPYKNASAVSLPEFKEEVKKYVLHFEEDRLEELKRSDRGHGSCQSSLDD